MVCADVVLLAISIVGCKLTEVHVNVGKNSDVFLMAFILIGVLAVYWKDENRPRLLDSILVIPWILLLIPLIIFPMLIAARLRLPLQDAHLMRIDQLFGINVASIALWAQHHRLGSLISESYSFLIYLLIPAALVPALTGKLKRAREFVIANLAGIAIGMALFALVPAVGPWYVYHFQPRPDQAYCQAQFFLLRSPGPYYFGKGAGVVCFPSFHVFWAIVCAYSLWDFRFLRPLVALVSTLIILSTMTTGWHYFSDVLAGMILAGLSIAIARAYTRRSFEETGRDTMSAHKEPINVA